MYQNLSIGKTEILTSIIQFFKTDFGISQGVNLFSIMVCIFTTAYFMFRSFFLFQTFREKFGNKTRLKFLANIFFNFGLAEFSFEPWFTKTFSTFAFTWKYNFDRFFLFLSVFNEILYFGLTLTYSYAGWKHPEPIHEIKWTP